MSRRIRNLSARSFAAFCWAAMPLAVMGLASAGLENLSFGHEHVEGGHALHHHHVYFGPHEHHHDHDHDDHHGPAPQKRSSRPGTATVSAAPALFQPVPAGLLTAGPADFSLLALPSAPTPAAQPPLPTNPPRGPPLSIDVLAS